MSYERAKALLNRSVSRPTLYTVRLPNTWVSNETNRYLDFFCTQTAIPETRVETVFANGHDFQGIVREQPTFMMFGKPLSLTIIENSDYTTYSELRNWIGGTTINAAQQQVGTLGRSQRMRYYDQFTADMKIIKLEQTGPTFAGQIGYREVMEVNFINAYPINIGAISLNSAAENQYTTFQADFTYESYSITYPQGGSELVRQVARNIARVV